MQSFREGGKKGSDRRSDEIHRENQSASGDAVGLVAPVG